MRVRLQACLGANGFEWKQDHELAFVDWFNGGNEVPSLLWPLVM
jgi:hypothetical protein